MSTSSAVSRRYAKAIVDAAKSDEQIDQFAAELATFCEVCESGPDLYHVLSNPMFGQRDRASTLDAVFAKIQTSNTIQRFIQLLVKRGRTTELSSISTGVREIADVRAKRIRAKVETASPLSDDTRESLRRALARRTGMTVQLDISIDPSLLGGIRTSVGSLVFDGTLKSHLTGLREQLQSQAE
jgi:F-type H+-transporting ATPase subunit delta